jgi:formylglycine-generating enzyme required for sulfatase activity
MKILYSLSGIRVMKDHDNADGDSDPFSGSIEPENPLNIAYIAYNSISNVFYLKDPYDTSDFNWKTLSDYYNYSSITRQNDASILLNDFDKWPELSGWTESNPQSAPSLPNKETISNYPVTFIRWWGAKAFADFYQLKLPSEAQWEYAAKGGNDFKYSVFDGVSTNDANWNSSNLNPATHHVLDVKSGSANPYGLYNMGGNVWEWMADNYASYSESSVDNPVIEESGSTSRSWRGGSWNYHEATLETSGRFFDDENRGNDHFGFRVVDKH